MHQASRLLATAIVASGIALGFSVSPAAAKAKAPAAAPVSPEALGFDSQRLKVLDSAMAQVVADGRVAGMTTLLARHGKVVQFKTYGKKDLATGANMDKDTIVRIYSMTKPLTGVAMMILFEQGKWHLDDPVTRFVPEFKNLRVMTGLDDKGNMITVPADRAPTMREIMSHTAGFGYGLGDKHPVDKMFRERKVLAANGLQDMVTRVADIPLMFQPGTQWSYSVSVDIQGYIVEKITGQKLGDFMAANIFKPLKMNDTAFFTGPEKASRLSSLYVGMPKTGKLVVPNDLFGASPPDYTKAPNMESGGGGLVSTTADYGRFAQMMLNKGELDGARILSPASIELMGTNVIPKSVLVTSNGTNGSRFNEAVGFGLDFMVDKDPRAMGSLEGKGTISWGGAAGTWFWIDPTNDLYFVGMVQRLGGTGGDDLGTQARTLTYQALTHPEK